ncbi:Uncharacterised protein [Halioglobus japonicus]|nr:Uncharacterised protein [Halioglobus japonicus]
MAATAIDLVCTIVACGQKYLLAGLVPIDDGRCENHWSPPHFSADGIFFDYAVRHLECNFDAGNRCVNGGNAQVSTSDE